MIFIDSQLADSAILIYHFCWYVCLSLCPSKTGTVLTRFYESSNFLLSGRTIIPVIWAPPPLQKFEGKCQRGVTRGGKIIRFSNEIAVYFDNGTRQTQLQWITNTKSQVADQSVTVPMTSSSHERQYPKGQFYSGWSLHICSYCLANN